IETLYLAVNYMAEKIESHFGDGGEFGCRIEYLRERTSLGTGGALALLPEPPQAPIVVINGDQVCNVDISAMLAAHNAAKPMATIGVGPYSVRIPFGTVVENNGRLVALKEKPTVQFLVNRGIYIIDPSVLGYVPANREFPITALLDALLFEKHPVQIYYFD